MAGGPWHRSATTSRRSTARCPSPRSGNSLPPWRRLACCAGEVLPMLREKLIDRHTATPRHAFRWRSREISRLEGLSDAIFGFAVTLLIVALEVPRTSGELLETMKGFVSFALTFSVLYLLWYR